MRAAAVTQCSGVHGLDLHGAAHASERQSAHAAIDSLRDSLPVAVWDTPGRSVKQMRQTAEYGRHVLTSHDTSWQGRSISS
jgi:hypothetical protein